MVDDDPVGRQMVGQMLENDGWTVTEAENGRVAFERLAEVRPDLILLDLMMPEMDGFEFAHELRRNPRWRDIPILVVTAKDLSEEDRRRLNGQVLGVLQKGAYIRDELLGEIRRELADRVRRERTRPRRRGRDRLRLTRPTDVGRPEPVFVGRHLVPSAVREPSRSRSTRRTRPRCPGSCSSKTTR